VCSEAEGDACHCKGSVYYGDKYHTANKQTEDVVKSQDLNHEVLTLEEMVQRPYKMKEQGSDGIFILCDYSVISGDFSLMGYQAETPK
jgi:hypothetical protein